MTRKQALANRDPVEFRESLKKAVKAAAEKRRRYREWMARHDSGHYDYDMRKAGKRKMSEVHPWKASEDANMEEWRAKQRKSWQIAFVTYSATYLIF